MNNGKSHAYFTWAARHAWVPPPVTPLPFSYTNQTTKAPPLAPHDPRPLPNAPADWVRPDFVIKGDDDSFVMLGELEARLRVEMHAGLNDPAPYYYGSPPIEDPLVYWGYLVKNKFMGGEMYGLSWSIVSWIAQSESVKALTRGAEDKLVAKWMMLHPRAGSVRWKSEHCWIYDHPKAGTVYSHGFLFPSEASRVRRQLTGSGPQKVSAPPSVLDTFSHSSVSQFGTRYSPPAPNLTPMQSVEALIEGSAMSRVGQSNYLQDPSLEPALALQRAVNRAWLEREGRKGRYEGKKLGGTVLVHFIKKNEWWEETALALLGGDEYVYSSVPFTPGRTGSEQPENGSRSSDVELEPVGTGAGEETGTDVEMPVLVTTTSSL